MMDGVVGMRTSNAQETFPTQFHYELEINAHDIRYKPVTVTLSYGLVFVLLLGLRSLLVFNNIYVNVAHIISFY